MHIFWDITRECNLNCTHCYNAPERSKMPPDLTFEQRNTLIRDLGVRYPNAVLHLLGGEPTLIPELEELSLTAKSNALKLELTTNGTNSSDKIIKLLKTLYHTVHLSLDGTSPQENDLIRGHGSFDKAIAFLKQWRATTTDALHQSKLDLSFTLTQKTLNSAERLINLCLKNEIKTLTIQPIKILGNAKKTGKKLGIAANEYFEYGEKIAKLSLGEDIRINFTGGSMKYKEHIKWTYYNDIVSVEPKCDAGDGQLRISPQGIIQPCIMAENINTSDIQIIHVRDLTKNYVQQTVDGIEFAQASRALKSTNFHGQPDLCKECIFFLTRVCYGGCAVQANFGPAHLCRVLEDRTIEKNAQIQ